MDSTARPAFDKALKQRNSLLKALAKNPGVATKSLQTSLIDWNQKFVDAATELIVSRQKAIELLSPKLNEIYLQLTNGKDTLGLKYEGKSLSYPSLNDPSSIKQHLHEALSQFRDVEFARGLTMVGPHRDDIEITINEMAARTHASQGEAWSVALAWRVATFDLSLDRYQSPPVLLLDDVFTQLDLTRRDLLISRFAKADQVLITTAVASDVPRKLWNHQFEIKDGEVIAIT
jgi:DNA replication and repair protein RecF